jgi:hypothetical protein
MNEAKVFRTLVATSVDDVGIGRRRHGQTSVVICARQTTQRPPSIVGTDGAVKNCIRSSTVPIEFGYSNTFQCVKIERAWDPYTHAH